MAYKAFHTCDHCGKILDDMKDWIGCTIDEALPQNISFDLCDSCIAELTDVIYAFVTEKRGVADAC